MIESSFYRAWPGIGPILQQPVGELDAANPIVELPGGHNVTLLEKLKAPQERLWCARQTLQHGWSRPVPVHQIESELHLRQGKALTNFARRVAAAAIRPGSGGAQGRLCSRLPANGGEDFYIDLLFYHLKLRCFVVIELKTGPFKPEHAGKMSFYLAAADDLLRHPHDQPSIGIILCKSKN